MGRINYRSVLAGGLLAGLVLVIGEFILNEILVAGRWEAAMEHLGVAMPSGAAVVVYVIMLLILGIAIVWLYAAIRPRFGPGPGTAVCAGLFTWFLVWVWSFAGSSVWGFFPWDLVTIVVIWGVVETVVAALAGAWRYREDPAGSTL